MGGKMITFEDIEAKIKEETDWRIVSRDNSAKGFAVWELENFSPAGEDLVISVGGITPEGMIRDIVDFANNFDPDEHIERWIEARHNGVRVVPSIRVLVEDADAIEEMLQELADKVNELKEK